MTGVETAPKAVHVVVPATIDDPATPSGGNVYDRRVCDGLAAAGWVVHEHPVGGSWPLASSASRDALSRAVAGVPDGAVVAVDGLVACATPEVFVHEASRISVVVVVHMPLGQRGAAGTAARDAECRTLSAATAVVTTSEWSRRWLLDHYALDAARIHVARPGAEIAAESSGTPSGGELLCVAAVTPSKGHDVLVEALTEVSDLRWRCALLGDLSRDPGFVARIREAGRRGRIDDRLKLVGPRVGADLEEAYAHADVLVLASRMESYGMVVTEALAHGVPVIATRAGGLPEAMGELSDGGRPGLLVPPDDPPALAAALRLWFLDDSLRRRLRHSAVARRSALTGWSTTTRRFAEVLTGAAVS